MLTIREQKRTHNLIQIDTLMRISYHSIILNKPHATFLD